ncbi:MAG TPA: tail fiber domain-containing protein [Saprospiraceae bacterium]|nr:tail fiber domain-containing protein [Saprospiraceae bacterium]
MKAMSIFIILFCAQAFSLIFAQNNPQGIHYQCILRDNTGKPLANQSGAMTFSILSETGEVEYTETQNVTTNEFGLINTIIGHRGIGFDKVQWAKTGQPKLTRAEFNNVVLGTSPLMSVPYALYAYSAKVETDTTLTGNGTATSPLKIARQGATKGQLLRWDGTNWVPQDAIGVNGLYTAGSGIQITGATIHNIGDKDPTDDLTGTSQSGGDINGVFANLVLIPGAVTQPKLADGAVGPAKLQDNAVTQPKLADGAVGPAKLQDNAVTQPKLADGAVGPAKLQDNCVSEQKLADGSVTSPKLREKAVKREILADTAVNEPKLADGSVSPAKLQSNSVTQAKIANAAITAAKLSQMGAAVNQVLKWNGTTWAPAADATGLSYSGGTGIQVAGSVISNTGDLSNSNEIQTLNLAGQILTLNPGGGSVNLSNAGTSLWTLSGGDIYNNNSGNVAINSTNAGSYPLKVKSNSGFGLDLEASDNANNWELFVTSGASGNLELYYNTSYRGYFNSSTGNYIPTSDRRFKNDILSVGPVLTKITQLRPVTYKFIQSNPEEKRTIGFIAQEVEQIFPELVEKNILRTGEEVFSLNYNGFSILAVRAIQEQQSQIDQLQNENALLKAQLQQIQEAIGSLKAKINK